MIGNRAARIYVRETFAGILSETDEGYSFVYDKDYLLNPDSPSVSLTCHGIPPVSFRYGSEIL